MISHDNCKRIEGGVLLVLIIFVGLALFGVGLMENGKAIKGACDVNSRALIASDWYSCEKETK